MIKYFKKWVSDIKFYQNHGKLSFLMFSTDFYTTLICCNRLLFHLSSKLKQQKHWFGRNFNFIDHIGSEKGFFLGGGFFSNRNLKNIFIPIASEYFSTSISGVRIVPTFLNKKTPRGSEKGSKNRVFQGHMCSTFSEVEPPLPWLPAYTLLLY